MTRRPNILVVYYLTQHPLRAAVRDHLYALRRYSACRVAFLNLAVRRVPSWLSAVPIDLVVYHNSFLSTRWSDGLFERVMDHAQPLTSIGTRRVAMPQDEFLRPDLVEDFVEAFQVDTVLSVAPESEWGKIYPRLDRQRVVFQQVLTGYLDARTTRRIERLSRKNRGAREITIGYRARKCAPWLGRHGFLKGTLAEAVENASEKRGLLTDISTEDSDVLTGDDWYRFLLSCKYTIGVEGGSSLLDRDGTLRECVERYMATNSGWNFSDVERACFPQRDGELELFALSPRHLEACATKTCQVLIEGSYNGVLEAGRHYIELKADFSNLDAVMDAVESDQRRREITEAAFQDVVLSGRFSYESLVDKLDAFAAAGERSAPSAEPRLRTRLTFTSSAVADRASWMRVIWRLRWRRRVRNAVPAPLRRALRTPARLGGRRS